MDHGDGRTQECAWNGWTITMDGDIDSQCAEWGSTKTGDPARVTPNKLTPAMEFEKVEPGAMVEGTQIGAAACIFMGAGGYLMRKRRLRDSPGNGGMRLELQGGGNGVV